MYITPSPVQLLINTTPKYKQKTSKVQKLQKTSKHSSTQDYEYTWAQQIAAVSVVSDTIIAWMRSLPQNTS